MVCLLALALACGDDTAPDANVAERDAAGEDAARDVTSADVPGADAPVSDVSGEDVGLDARVADAGLDVEADAGPGAWLRAEGWTNVVFPEISGSVRIEYDIRATEAPVNAVAGITLGRASRYQDLALIVRMNEESLVDVRDGGAYVADEVVPYTANRVFHVALEVDSVAHRYEARVTEEGSSEVLLRSSAAFRSERVVDSIDHLAFFEDTSRFEVGNLVVAGEAIEMEIEVPPMSDGLFGVDFQSSDPGPYTDAGLRSDWEGIRWSTLNDRASIEEEGGNRFVRVQYPRGGVGNGQGGAQWATEFQRFRGRTYDEMYVSYRLRFRPGFDFVLGGKLPGLMGGEGNTGGDRPDGTDGWSGRMMWRRMGAAVQYLYHPDQPTIYGDDLEWAEGGERHFPTGEWITVEHRIVMNTPGERNGIVQGWYNGVLALDRRDIRFRDVDTFAIDGFYFSTFFGGSGSQWASTRDEYIDYDDFVFSDEPITH